MERHGCVSCTVSLADPPPKVAQSPCAGESNAGTFIIAACLSRWFPDASAIAVPREELREYIPRAQFGFESTEFAQEITVYPIQRGVMINLAAFRARYDLEYTTFKGPWVQDVPPSEVLHDFDDWEPEVRMLLQVCDIYVLGM